MRMDSEMIGILLSDSMHYTIVVSLEMSDEPKIYCVTLSKNHGFSENLYGSTQAVDKTLVYEWKTKMNLTARSFANYEGMCLGPTLTDGSRTLLLCADSQNQAHGVLKDWFMSLVIR